MIDARPSHRPIDHDQLPWEFWGRVPYRTAVARLENARQEIWAEQDQGRLFLCEHDPVVTLGRGTCAGDVLDRELLERSGVAICETNRGGRATYHGPGQLMVYPVVRLKRGIVPYLEALAAALSALVAELGVLGAHWRRDHAGLWCNGKKLAACGLHVSRRVAIHGFALNIATPPAMWLGISPCGLGENAVTSVAEQRGAALPATLPDIAGMAAPLIERHLLGEAA